MNGSIYDKLNRQNSLDDYIRLTEVTSEAKAKELEAQSYYVGITADEWRVRFPSVPAENVICLKTLLFPPSLYYYDKEKGICFDTHISDGKVLMFGEGSSDAEYNKKMARHIADMEANRVNHNYKPLFSSVESEGSGNIVMTLLITYLMNDEPNAELYDIFIDEYGFCDCGSSLFTDPAIFERLAACKSKAQKQKTEKAMACFDDVIKVYRGEGSKSTPYCKAISWTTDINKAYFFAGWRGGDNARIITGTVRREDVLEYIEDRNESELLIVPGKVSDINVQSCVSMDMFKQFINGGVEGFSTTDFGDYCGYEINQYTRSVYQGRDDICDHDDEHSIRVGLYATFLFRSFILAEKLGCPVAEEKQIDRIYKSLTLACAWHDFGRTDNEINEDHGARSCEAFLLSHRADKMAQFFMEYHCKSDEEARAYWKKKFSAAKNPDLIWTAFCIMKDADALDRCRFGNQSEDYVDVSYLRLPLSKSLLPVAQELQSYTLPD